MAAAAAPAGAVAASALSRNLCSAASTKASTALLAQLATNLKGDAGKQLAQSVKVRGTG